MVKKVNYLVDTKFLPIFTTKNLKSVVMITKNVNDYCVILAGGRGRRLWPCSRIKKPKQFVDFFSTGRTLLQDTFDRVSKFIPLENIYVCTNHEYAHYVINQLPEMPPENILSEPIHRNTAPSVAWATYRIVRRNENARMMVVPSDQTVFKEDVFQENIQAGMELVSQKDIILTLGVTPTRPEPGYGYIQCGEYIESDGIYEVKSFTEKPDREFAKMFISSGEFLWNSGIYLSNVKNMRRCLQKVFPVVLRRLEDQDEISHVSLEDEILFIEENFSTYPNASIDEGLLENGQVVYVMKGDFGWADLGMWHSIYESHQKGEDDNVVISSRVIIDNSKNNIIKLPKDKLGIIHGLEGYIVAEEGNVLLICKKEDSSALVRKFVNETQLQYGEDFL